MEKLLEEALVSVWRQALAERAKAVKLGDETLPVVVLKSKRLRTVEFLVDGQPISGVEQNPNTKSRWAEMARAGKKVMQCMSAGKYLAVVVDGKVTTYGAKR
jgi:hypothetical protein